MSFASSPNHSFDILLAEELKSVDLAILLQHFQFWIIKNKRMGKNQIQGRTWTYQTIKEIASHFPYWSFDQVTRLVRKCIELKLIRKGNFNKSKVDKTAWYAFENEEKFTIKRFRFMEEAESPDGSSEIASSIDDKDTLKDPEKISVSEPAVGLTAFFLEKLKEMNPKIRQPNLKSWEKEMGRIMTVDNRTEKEIKDVINFIVEQHNNPKKEFTWSKAVASPEKLRKHFAAIWMEMNTKNPAQKKESVDNEKIKRIQENKKWATEMSKKLEKKGIGEDLFKLFNDRVNIRHKKRNLDYMIYYQEIAFSKTIENILRNLGAL